MGKPLVMERLDFSRRKQEPARTKDQFDQARRSRALELRLLRQSESCLHVHHREGEVRQAPWRLSTSGRGDGYRARGMGVGEAVPSRPVIPDSRRRAHHRRGIVRRMSGRTGQRSAPRFKEPLQGDIGCEDSQPLQLHRWSTPPLPPQEVKPMPVRREPVLRIVSSTVLLASMEHLSIEVERPRGMPLLLALGRLTLSSPVIHPLKNFMAIIGAQDVRHTQRHYHPPKTGAIKPRRSGAGEPERPRCLRARC